MSSELLATYAGLGTHDGEHYYKGEECLGIYDLTFIALETCGCACMVATLLVKYTTVLPSSMCEGSDTGPASRRLSLRDQTRAGPS